MIRKIIRNIKDPRKVLIKILAEISPMIKSDRIYISIRYWLFMNKKLNLKNPKTFNEKLNWMKINYHDPIYSKLVDKYEAKQIVAKQIGDRYIIPTLGVWEKFEDIDFDKLPNQFVLKCTHDSGGLIICKDKNKLDLERVRKKIEFGLKRNYYSVSREWGYKLVKPRIIAETFMSESDGAALKDYKFFCFDGKPSLLYVTTDRDTEVKFDYFDLDFNHLPIKNAHKNSDEVIEKPATFEKMKIIAEKLSKNFPFMRIDLYEISGQVYFGEFTVYHNGGTLPFEPEEWDYLLGEMLKLPKRKV